VLESQEFSIPSLGSPDLASGLFALVGLIVLSLCQCFDTVVGVSKGSQHAETYATYPPKLLYPYTTTTTTTVLRPFFIHKAGEKKLRGTG